MLTWLRLRLFGVPSASSSKREVAPPAERPRWVEELRDAGQKQARASAKQTARLEAALADLDARFALLGSAVEARDAARFAELFDALDALDVARGLTAEPHLAEGLSRVQGKLTGFLGRSGYKRITTRGEPPDARMTRVVGTEPSTAIAPGSVTTVVRAAILSGDAVVREGEVLVSTGV